MTTRSLNSWPVRTRFARLGLRACAAVLAASSLLTTSLSMAQAQEDYPSRIITMIVPFPAGGTTDVVGRVMAQSLSEQLGQNVIVENRGGAGGNIGSALVAEAQPDGHTLLVGTVGTHAINAGLYPNMPFDHVADFAPISRVASVPNVLVVNPQRPYHSVEELVAYATENPGDIFYASSGNGTSIHLSGELFKVLAEVDMEHVPYAGSAPAVTGLLGNQVAIMFDNLPSAIQHIRSGALLALAVTSSERAAALPDVPTIAEQGYPEYEASSWFGLFAPAGTPEDIVQRLNEAVQTALNDPEIIARLEQQGATPQPETPEEFADFIAAETEKWGHVIEASGATID